MFALVDEALEERLTDPQERQRWLVLDKHPDFPGHWIVEGFTQTFLFDLNEVIGSYRALAPSGLGRFMEVAEDCGYQVAFFEDPTAPLEEFSYLNKVPEVIVNSKFDNTINGMLPYQVQGYNLLKEREWGVARWDTGTGKTVLASALVKYHQVTRNFDYCFFVVKAHNKFNTARKLLDHVGVNSTVIDGSLMRRERLYCEVTRFGNHMPVMVMNYEQFKNDFVTWKTVTDSKGKSKKKLEGLSKWGAHFFENTRVLAVWDEMPTKLKTRTTQTYQAICYCLYRTAPPQVKWEQLRPKSLRSYMLSATPIENSPEDWFNCVRLLDGGTTYGTVTAFNNEYVASWNYFDPTKPERFHNLERMRLKAATFVHQVNKNDPDIAAIFPKVIEEPVLIDWDPHHGKLYQDIQAYAKEQAQEEEFEDLPIFALLGVLQMVCDAPEMILNSAALREAYDEEEDDTPRGSAVALALKERFGNQFTNKDHPKLDKLREILTERHPTEQVALYTRWNQAIMPYLETALSDWGLSYVRYNGTTNQKQAAQDAFQNQEVRVFLSSDSGSDSIDLDAGNVVIDYDLPWKWTTLTQRHNRVHRASSEYETVYYYSLMMEGSVEQRVLQVIQKKQAYHNELFDAAAGDVSSSARMTKQELLYILTGR